MYFKCICMYIAGQGKGGEKIKHVNYFQMCARVLTDYGKITLGALDLFFMRYRRNKLISSPVLGELLE